ncbi:glycosyltransferase family 4 protein [Sphingomonas sp.]|jgi:glycosyltransferase involved in cell wall biosynthesis|uniref:glycosyltransferase family 4 protein n=1 Tax=Sphingomonas sp. TaxID=28214 RepID=UPI002D7EBD06|nr:glycosyltransferase family 4 protein [Sphingomonas sp.]HEU0045008.1 glycosyltransferase family 4 protein [Sphingomonas sp.]
MKILMTCDAVGGVWQYAHDLSAALGDSGVEVVLAVLGPSSRSGPAVAPAKEGKSARVAPMVARPADRHGCVRTIPTNLPLDWLAPDTEAVRQAGRAIAGLAAAHDVDLIHLNSPALATAGDFPVPVVAVTHGCIGTWFAAADHSAPSSEYAWHGEAMRAGLLAADVVVAPSASYAAEVQRHYALPFTPLVVHNGRAPAEARRAESADYVLTAGRLWDRAKNVALLDAVAARLSVPFRAAGPVVGPHGETVAPAHLHLLGTLGEEALAAQYVRTPIFVSATRFEPFGLAVLEAAQAGCPLVLSSIDTFRELWAGAALLVPDEEPAAYVAAIARIRSEPGLRAHLSQAARARAARYTPAAMAAGMLAIYRGLVSAPERVAA